MSSNRKSKNTYQPEPISKDNKMTIKLLSNFTDICIKKCLINIESDLNEDEKKCLGKCIDRAYDYCWVVGKGKA